MAQPLHTIHIHALAPAKPAPGAHCNGCGVCCLYEPCPVGMVLSRRRAGACDAVLWDSARAQYRCGAVQAPNQTLKTCLPLGLGWSANLLAPVLGRLARRWIAAGIGCDSTLEVLAGADTSPGADAQAPVSTTIPTSISSTGNARRCDSAEHD